MKQKVSEILIQGNTECWLSQSHLIMESFHSWESSSHVKSICIPHNGLQICQASPALCTSTSPMQLTAWSLPFTKPQTTPERLPSQWPILNIQLSPRELTKHCEKGTNIPWYQRPKFKNQLSTHQPGELYQVTEVLWASVSRNLERNLTAQGNLRDYEVMHEKGPAHNSYTMHCNYYYYHYYYYYWIIWNCWSCLSISSSFPCFSVVFS